MTLRRKATGTAALVAGLIVLVIIAVAGTLYLSSSSTPTIGTITTSTRTTSTTQVLSASYTTNTQTTSTSYTTVTSNTTIAYPNPCTPYTCYGGGVLIKYIALTTSRCDVYTFTVNVTDHSGTSRPPFQYQWDYGDNATAPYLWQQTPTGSNLTTHTYSSAGSYIVQVEVTDTPLGPYEMTQGAATSFLVVVPPSAGCPGQ